MREGVMVFGSPPGGPPETIRVVATTGAKLSAVLAACGVGAFIFYMSDEGCTQSSESVAALYVAPVLFGLASFLFVTRAVPRRWWWGLAAGVATIVAGAPLLFFIAFVEWANRGCLN